MQSPGGLTKARRFCDAEVNRGAGLDVEDRRRIDDSVDLRACFERNRAALACVVKVLRGDRKLPSRRERDASASDEIDSTA